MEKDHDKAQSASWGEYNSPRLPDPESQWAECISDNGEVYYHNVVTGETSWTKPGAELEHHESSEWAGDGTEGHMIDEGNAVFWEGLETPGEAEAGEATQWLELYDPVQQMTYYFSPQSGKVRWEPPSEDLNAIRHCDSDAVLSTVVSLQSAARSQQARTRVASIRQQKTIEHQLEDNHTDDVKFAAEGIGEEDAVNEVGVDHTDEQETSHNLDSQWIEVYDPVAQQQYYYSPRTNETRWNTPETLTTPSDDRKVAAAISIQSLSRGRRARKEVNELRTHTPHHGNQQELDREAMHRREMNHQELLQLKGGDRFWGVDVYEHEMMQQRLEEELSARTKSLNTQIAATRPPQPDAFVLNIQPLEYPEYEYFEEEVDQEQLQRDAQDEYNARLAMSHEEAQQCQNGDSFWGIQAEEARQNNSNIAMAQEEAASRRFADSVIELALSATWEAEVQQSATKELVARGGQEQRMQDRYLRWFYRQCVSVDELLDYRWPTKQQQERLEEVSSPSKRRRQNVTRPFQDVVESATPFPLDDLIVRERLEHGDLRYGLRSVVTVHHQSVHGTNGTHYQITKASPECAFDEVTAAALLKTEMLAYSSDPQTEDRCADLQDDRAAVNNLDGELIPGSSVNYRCSDIPDPHIPARFNGVPYKPNQISPTKEILSGDHRKLNQLPSLARSNSTTEAPKLRRLQKAKAKARAKLKEPRALRQQESNNANANLSRGQDATSLREEADTIDDGPRAQFKRQEHHVLSKLFALMDVDGSGTVNQKEMRWALQRDAEIHALAKTSPQLRLLLKQRARLEALFSKCTHEGQFGVNADSDVRDDCSDELSWEEFLSRCEESYLNLMAEGLIQPDTFASARPDNRSRESPISTTTGLKTSNLDELSEKATEAQTIRRVFSLLDMDHNGVLDVAEIQRALYHSASKTRPNSTGSTPSELQRLVRGSRALQPMLHQELFMAAFSKFEPLDPRGISEEEFVAFCLEIAQVAAVNNMVTSVG